MFEWWCVILGALVIAFVAYSAGYNDGFRRGFTVCLNMFEYGDVEDDGTVVWRTEKPEDGEGNVQKCDQVESEPVCNPKSE